jgi:hypothetical protein
MPDVLTAALERHCGGGSGERPSKTRSRGLGGLPDDVKSIVISQRPAQMFQQLRW